LLRGHALKKMLYGAGVGALSFFPVRGLKALDMMVQSAQGRGWSQGDVHEEVAAVSQLLPGLGRDRSPVVLDVGANQGHWTRAFLQSFPRSRMWCFEPSQVAFTALVAELDGCGVQLVNAALSDVDGPVKLWSDGPGSTLGSLSRRDLDHYGLAFDTVETVEAVTLDAWMVSEGLQHIDVLKLDVEGHEYQALLGGLSTLPNIDLVQLEFGGCNIDSRVFFRDLWTILRDAGFTLYRLAPRGPVPIKKYSEREESFLYSVIYAVRRTRISKY
jgi:FkbM family methyltransferase